MRLTFFSLPRIANVLKPGRTEYKIIVLRGLRINRRFLLQMESVDHLNMTMHRDDNLAVMGNRCGTKATESWDK